MTVTKLGIYKKEQNGNSWVESRITNMKKNH